MRYEDKPGLSQLAIEDDKGLELTAMWIGDRVCCDGGCIDQRVRAKTG